ncbi:MAG: thiamine biosynthesis protein ThiS [Hyphomicrobiales bacterium]|nr:thiamine biosynthesis protein ThiS [Hyphomicrobiales bacterium]
MKIYVNGVEREGAYTRLSELWAEQSRENEIASPRGFAMAVNGELVRRDQWDSTPVAAGDRIEIVRAFAGG